MATRVCQWSPLLKEINEKTMIATEIIRDRVNRHPNLNIDTTLDRLVMKQKVARTSKLEGNWSGAAPGDHHEPRFAQ